MKANVFKHTAQERECTVCWRLQKNVLQFGRDFAALSSAIYLLTQNVEVLRGMQMAV